MQRSIAGTAERSERPSSGPRFKLRHYLIFPEQSEYTSVTVRLRDCSTPGQFSRCPTCLIDNVVYYSSEHFVTALLRLGIPCRRQRWVVKALLVCRAALASGSPSPAPRRSAGVSPPSAHRASQSLLIAMRILAICPRAIARSYWRRPSKSQPAMLYTVAFRGSRAPCCKVPTASAATSWR